MPEHDALIGKYTHEKHQPRADEALQMLRKIASMVKPLMRKRGWKVGTLSELSHERRDLLGLNYNHGVRICLRLRYPNDPSLFMPLEQVTDTMLHELSHNVFGPHDEKFHALWNELRDEYEALVRKGYTGEGFLSDGQRLGGRGRVPIQEARRLARAAAETRRGQNIGGERRLGGSRPSDVVDIRKTIADAAQRRLEIMKGCGSTDTSDKVKNDVLMETQRNAIQTNGDIDDDDMFAIQLAFIEMLEEDERAACKEGKSGSSKNDKIKPEDEDSKYSTPSPIPLSTRPNGFKVAGTTPSSSDTWSCQICTYENPSTFLCCEICGVEQQSDDLALAKAIAESETVPRKRPREEPPGAHKILRSTQSAANVARFKEAEAKALNSKPVGWTCHTCGNFMESAWWTCSQCGTMKLHS